MISITNYIDRHGFQKAFDMYEEPERVIEVIETNLRDEDAPVPQYLLSRSVAGMYL